MTRRLSSYDRVEFTADDDLVIVRDPESLPKNHRAAAGGLLTYLANALSLSASRITSGVFANARISASSVTQHNASIAPPWDNITGKPQLEPANANLLKRNATAQLDAGYTVGIHDIGVVTSGQVSLDPAQSNQQQLTIDGVGIELVAPGANMQILVINGPNAGLPTFTGFTSVQSGSYVDTDAAEFFFHITAINGRVSLIVEALT